MLVHEGMGYDRFGRRYVSAEEIEARKKRILAVDVSKLGEKIPIPQKLKQEIIHRKHLKMMEEERKTKVRQAQVISFIALAVADMSVGIYHTFSNNPNQAYGDILCTATALGAAASLSVPFFRRAKQKEI